MSLSGRLEPEAQQARRIQEQQQAEQAQQARVQQAQTPTYWRPNAPTVQPPPQARNVQIQQREMSGPLQPGQTRPRLIEVSYEVPVSQQPKMIKPLNDPFGASLGWYNPKTGETQEQIGFEPGTNEPVYARVKQSFFGGLSPSENQALMGVTAFGVVAGPVLVPKLAAFAVGGVGVAEAAKVGFTGKHLTAEEALGAASIGEAVGLAALAGGAQINEKYVRPKVAENLTEDYMKQAKINEDILSGRVEGQTQLWRPSGFQRLSMRLTGAQPRGFAGGISTFATPQDAAYSMSMFDAESAAFDMGYTPRASFMGVNKGPLPPPAPFTGKNLPVYFGIGEDLFSEKAAVAQETREPLAFKRAEGEPQTDPFGPVPESIKAAIEKGGIGSKLSFNKNSYDFGADKELAFSKENLPYDEIAQASPIDKALTEELSQRAKITSQVGKQVDILNKNLGTDLDKPNVTITGVANRDSYIMKTNTLTVSKNQSPLSMQAGIAHELGHMAIDQLKWKPTQAPGIASSFVSMWRSENKAWELAPKAATNLLVKLAIPHYRKPALASYENAQYVYNHKEKFISRDYLSILVHRMRTVAKKQRQNNQSTTETYTRTSGVPVISSQAVQEDYEISTIFYPKSGLATPQILSPKTIRQTQAGVPNLPNLPSFYTTSTGESQVSKLLATNLLATNPPITTKSTIQLQTPTQNVFAFSQPKEAAAQALGLKPLLTQKPMLSPIQEQPQKEIYKQTTPEMFYPNLPKTGNLFGPMPDFKMEHPYVGSYDPLRGVGLRSHRKRYPMKTAKQVLLG